MKRYVIARMSGLCFPAVFDGEQVHVLDPQEEDMTALICCALNQYDQDCTLGLLMAAQAEAELE